MKIYIFSIIFISFQWGRLGRVTSRLELLHGSRASQIDGLEVHLRSSLPSLEWMSTWCRKIISLSIFWFNSHYIIPSLLVLPFSYSIMLYGLGKRRGTLWAIEWGEESDPKSMHHALISMVPHHYAMYGLAIFERIVSINNYKNLVTHFNYFIFVGEPKDRISRIDNGSGKFFQWD